jgi:TDG/mug DNA glycosylase family protein
VLGEGLDVVFCGINPGRWSGAVGHHFAHPGNRFWKALYHSGFTDEELSPEDERRLLDLHLGITNLVRRTTATAAELTDDELRRAAVRLERKLRRLSPNALAILGLGAYRTAFGRPRATLGLQPERVAACPVWVLPNPSGLQATYGLERIVAEMAALRRAVRAGE